MRGMLPRFAVVVLQSVIWNTNCQLNLKWTIKITADESICDWNIAFKKKNMKYVEKNLKVSCFVKKSILSSI